MATCILSFVDTEGFRHTVEVQAESSFEAGVLAIRAFKQSNCPPGYVTQGGVVPTGRQTVPGIH